MAYRPDIYVEKNIIGYTGQIANKPTVYFLDASFNFIEFGHITQYHEEHLNIGRHEVDYADHYRIINGPDGAQEWKNGTLIHETRNPFVHKKDLDDTEKLLLALSILHYPFLKPLFAPIRGFRLGIGARA